jgi:non-ribosomal peptide synthetase component F
VDAVLRRHSSLRAAFQHNGRAEPVQVIAQHVRAPWNEVDLSNEPEQQREQRWRELRDRERATRFALDRAPLLRACLVRLSAHEHRLLLTNHHLLFDGWSLPLLVNDLLAAYPDADALPPAAGEYAHYLDWLAARDRPAAQDAWRAALDGVSGPTLLAGGHDDPYQPSAEHRLDLGPDLTARLTRLASETRVTAHTVLLAAWGVLLGQLIGESDVLIGSTVSGRPAELPGAEETVGLFINTVPARVAARPADSFAQVLREVHARQVDLLDHQHLGLADIQRAVGLGELFDTLLVFESYPVSRDALDEAAARAGLGISGLDSTDDTHYPLTVLVAPGEALGITLKYRPSVFDEDRVRSFGERLRALLTWCTANPDTPLARIDLLLPGETSGWSAPAVAPAEDLLAGFDRAVRRWPDRVAVRFEDEALTYAELDARVGRLARTLRERGAGPEKVVGIALRRSLELIVGVLATLRAGAAFLPLDPDQPAARLRTMLDEAAPMLVLTVGADVPETFDALPAATSLLVLDDRLPTSAAVFAPAPVDPECPAYVIYTSGSTGVPKGAVLTRAGLHNRLSWMAAHDDFGAEDVVVHKTPIGFDVSVWELVLPFLVGAELVIARPDGHRDPAYLAELIRTQRRHDRPLRALDAARLPGRPGGGRMHRPSAHSVQRRGTAHRTGPQVRLSSWMRSCTTSTARPRRASTSPPRATSARPVPAYPSARPSTAYGCACWTRLCDPYRPACPASSTSAACNWPAATTAAPD